MQLLGVHVIRCLIDQELSKCHTGTVFIEVHGATTDSMHTRNATNTSSTCRVIECCRIRWKVTSPDNRVRWYS
jgi:hypothetical protein